jgi:hypothetical protein
MLHTYPTLSCLLSAGSAPAAHHDEGDDGKGTKLLLFVKDNNASRAAYRLARQFIRLAGRNGRAVITRLPAASVLSTAHAQALMYWGWVVINVDTAANLYVLPLTLIPPSSAPAPAGDQLTILHIVGSNAPLDEGKALLASFTNVMADHQTRRKLVQQTDKLADTMLREVEQIKPDVVILGSEVLSTQEQSRVGWYTGPPPCLLTLLHAVTDKHLSVQGAVVMSWVCQLA